MSIADCSSTKAGHGRSLREEREEDRGIRESEGDTRKRCDDPGCLMTARPIKEAPFRKGKNEKTGRGAPCEPEERHWEQ